MKVSELMEFLSTQPPDMEVVTDGDNFTQRVKAYVGDYEFYDDGRIYEDKGFRMGGVAVRCVSVSAWDR